ncbi:unnamed protein product [Boreogadus saida]
MQMGNRKAWADLALLCMTGGSHVQQKDAKQGSSVHTQLCYAVELYWNSFIKTSVDLAEAIDIFRAGVPDAQDADDEHIEVDDVTSFDNVFADSASGFSRSGASTEANGECFRTRSSSRRATQCPLFPPVQNLFTAVFGDPSTLKAPVRTTDFTNVEGWADTQAWGIPRLEPSLPALLCPGAGCQPIAVSAGRHMAWATMIQRAIWLSHTAVTERERASLIQGPLAPDGLFGPRFSEVLAHQQSVRENRSRFGAILTGSSHQQAGRKRGPGRFQRPPPTPMPQQ